MSRDSRVAGGIALWLFWRRVAERVRVERSPGVEFTRRPRLWQVLSATWRRASDHNITIVAAGVAFYAFLSIFPAIAASVSIYGLVSDPADVQKQLETLAGAVPQETLDILSEQMTAVASSSGAALSIGTLLGILLTAWSAKRGMDAAIVAMNIALGHSENRGFLKLSLVSLALSLGAILGAVLLVALLVALPKILEYLPQFAHIEQFISIARWPILLAALIIALAILYRYGPADPKAPWRITIVGGIVAGILLVAASALFSIYAANFGKYNETYGSLGAIVVLMLWLFVSSYVVLLVAELNAVRMASAADTNEAQLAR
jgi:membrane protein